MPIGSNSSIATSVGRKARVLRSNPAKNTMDVIYLDDGTVANNVIVASGMTGANHGSHYLPDPRPQSALGKPDDVDLGLDKVGDRDMTAIVINLIGGIPAIIAFLPPEKTSNAFNYADYPDMSLNRHVSDFEQVTMADGSTSFRHPSGTTIRIGAVPSLNGKDLNKKYKHTRNKKKIPPITLTVPADAGGKSEMTLDKNGDITISAPNSIAIRINDKINIKIDKSGNISMQGSSINVLSTGNIKLSGNSIDVNATSSLAVKGATVDITSAALVNMICTALVVNGSVVVS